jgi:very-short-patch-repair endonuclease
MGCFEIVGWESMKSRIDRFAAKMRRYKSWPEKKLWAKLRDNQLGVRFYAQKVILGYIADFHCPKARLVVEVDGKQHLKAVAVQYDKKRDAAMAKLGILTVRFTAQEIGNNLPAVVAMIRETLRRRS